MCPCVGQHLSDAILQEKIKKATSPALSDSQKMVSLSELIETLLIGRDINFQFGEKVYKLVLEVTDHNGENAADKFNHKLQGFIWFFKKKLRIFLKPGVTSMNVLNFT